MQKVILDNDDLAALISGQELPIGDDLALATDPLPCDRPTCILRLANQDRSTCRHGEDSATCSRCWFAREHANGDA